MLSFTPRHFAAVTQLIDIRLITLFDCRYAFFDYATRRLLMRCRDADVSPCYARLRRCLLDTIFRFADAMLVSLLLMIR